MDDGEGEGDVPGSVGWGGEGGGALATGPCALAMRASMRARRRPSRERVGAGRTISISRRSGA